MPDVTPYVPVDPRSPDPDIMDRAGTILIAGGVVIFPAQCLYGVAANALDPAAVEKVFRLKQRPKNNPILVLIRDKSALPDLAATIPDQARILMDTFWPGGITLVFKALPGLPPALTAHTGKIGIRIPAHPVARALVSTVDVPITGTSANLSGQPGCTTAASLPREIITACDLILDAGPVKGGTGSTIVDVTHMPPKILRHGAVAQADILKALA